MIAALLAVLLLGPLALGLVAGLLVDSALRFRAVCRGQDVEDPFPPGWWRQVRW